MPDTRPGEIVLGDHRTTGDGKLQVRGERLWIPYPPEAAKIIDFAHRYGWGTDDGLPVRRNLRDEIYVRILVGRERGPNANDPEGVSQAAQFHMMWWLVRDTWQTGTAYVKVGTRQSAWRQIKPAIVRKTIASNPVVLPSIYADEKEWAC